MKNDIFTRTINDAADFDRQFNSVFEDLDEYDFFPCDGCMYDCYECKYFKED